MSQVHNQVKPLYAVAGETSNRIAASQRGGITLSDLPSPETQRWTIRRKAAVVAGVRAGLISIEQACERYSLTVEEYLTWQRLIDAHGLRGLRATKTQDYRGTSKRN